MVFRNVKRLESSSKHISFMHKTLDGSYNWHGTTHPIRMQCNAQSIRHTKILSLLRPTSNETDESVKLRMQFYFLLLSTQTHTHSHITPTHSNPFAFEFASAFVANRFKWMCIAELTKTYYECALAFPKNALNRTLNNITHASSASMIWFTFDCWQSYPSRPYSRRYAFTSHFVRLIYEYVPLFSVVSKQLPFRMHRPTTQIISKSNGFWHTDECDNFFVWMHLHVL